MNVESKAVVLMLVMLCAGAAGGYFVGSMGTQQQIADLQNQLNELQEILQVQVSIEEVAWLEDNRIAVVLMNTGSVSASIESISVKKDDSGQVWYTDTSDDATGSVAVGDVRYYFTWAENHTSSEDIIEPGTAYVIRVTCTTGFSDEVTSISPSATQAQTAVRIDNVEFDVVADVVTVTVRNIGSVDADIVLIGLKRTSSSSYTTETVAVTIAVGTAENIIVDFSGSFDITTSSNYDVKVKTSTGYENVKTNLAP